MPKIKFGQVNKIIASVEFIRDLVDISYENAGDIYDECNIINDILDKLINED